MRPAGASMAMRGRTRGGNALPAGERGRYTVQVFNANTQTPIDFELAIDRGVPENRRA